MFERLKEIERRYEELSGLLADPEIVKDTSRYAELAREHSSLEELVMVSARLKDLLTSIRDSEAMMDDPDPEIRSLAREDLETLGRKRELLEQRIRDLLIPRDPNDDRDVILEIRAGTGGDEAALFAADLFRMYGRYAEAKGWDVEILSANETGIGGYKEIIAGIRGKGAYSRLKYESGVHRVQRVPVTEASGRIHTSAVTVAVLPEAEDVDVAIDPNDLRIDTFRASGAGGQHVNKTESAIRITHIPTGIVVTCQDEKSQHKNKAKALRVIRSRILQKMQEEQAMKIASQRRMQVGTGDRSERIRTYNFPQGRVTDHRVNLTVHRLGSVLEGDLDDIIDELSRHDRHQAFGRTGS